MHFNVLSLKNCSIWIYENNEWGGTHFDLELMLGCGCAGSEFGCCPDGETAADGQEFEGCESKPGGACFLKNDKGKVITSQKLVTNWSSKK